MIQEEVLGVVLAGGASRRMGFDKCQLVFENQSLLERAVDVLGPSCGEVVISGGRREPDDSPVRTISDLRVDSGPLAGLEAALVDAAPKTRSVFLLACDLPFVSSEVVGYLLEEGQRRPDYDAVVPSLDGRLQPLCGLYRPPVLRVAEKHLE